VGLTLTCFFFAYENVFYIIANSLGAWAPREVNYSDLLSTVFPWVYVLFFGWFPAISEEFISRMFSIPFFEKILRTRAGAIVIAAVIWGFGHAAYPNQPFWIRGLEVGLAGVIFGLVFLRFGIAAVVITHFSVDALYSAFVMIRSESLYYQLTGSLSAGIFGVVFLGMLVAYIRRGGFAAPG
jgi:membrane protease YdiL (CAAX protease family)